ncbi:aldo/keto reductase [Kinneretia asaccharophila]|uniref:Aryl-alcohol dehydrogenase-like predicted oxidoreductase n=1 Tax=Roseateles asaccharophilus TaxID=582607 RepID=A0A4R6MWN8_9BURK|nr:aldo/keto reductase [Roseateles asaccharophilus]MDN3545901.1 aldo/keto reductase [Roseateles asaccharophilus]TDP06647.1 aryl-alcohol dehydrogenase-like predicted oxidoreductase [Roseateles asaccharophilus]
MTQLALPQRPLGRSGLQVSALGFGAMHLQDARLSEAEAGRLLNQVLDLGISLIDTARSYGLSEERIGRHLAHRRDEFLLSTKLGYGVEGVADWSYACIVQGVERALRLMRCEWLDIAHLHSCPLPLLQRAELTRALLDCQRAGKLRVAAYSGDNAELAHALACGDFGSVQTSLSLCDQINLSGALQRAEQAGIGLIVKRPVAGAIWHRPQRPGDHAEGQYWDRWQALALPDTLLEEAGERDWTALALRFAAHAPGVSSALTGTAKLAHLQANLAAVQRGPLPEAVLRRLRRDFRPDWTGLI